MVDAALLFGNICTQPMADAVFAVTDGGDRFLPILTNRGNAGTRLDIFDSRRGLRVAAINALDYWIVYGYRADVLGRLVGQVSGDVDAALAQCKLWLADGTL